MAKQKATVTGVTKNKQASVTISTMKNNYPGFTNIHPVIGVLKISRKVSPVTKKMQVLSKLNSLAEKDFTKDIRDTDMSQPGPGNEINIPSTGDDTTINYGLGEDKNNYAGDDHGE